MLGRLIPGVGIWIANILGRHAWPPGCPRQDEYEADAYAAALLTRAGIGTGPQKSLFLKLEGLTGMGGRGMPRVADEPPKDRGPRAGHRGARGPLGRTIAAGVTGRPLASARRPPAPRVAPPPYLQGPLARRGQNAPPRLSSARRSSGPPDRRCAVSCTAATTGADPVGPVQPQAIEHGIGGGSPRAREGGQLGAAENPSDSG